MKNFVNLQRMSSIEFDEIRFCPHSIRIYRYNYRIMKFSDKCLRFRRLSLDRYHWRSFRSSLDLQHRLFVRTKRNSFDVWTDKTKNNFTISRNEPTLEQISFLTYVRTSPCNEERNVFRWVEMKMNSFSSSCSACVIYLSSICFQRLFNACNWQFTKCAIERILYEDTTVTNQ